MSDFYIHRKLHSGGQLVQDHALLEKGGILVVLAEPGAGKSDLLDYFARELNVPRELASLFIVPPASFRSILIVDALDEVARINEEKISELIVKARDSSAGKVIFASRSYVWDEARTQLVRDCFGIAPVILRLEPFDEEEQRELFEHELPDENFEAFYAEASRFELTPILGNPQFLKLLADAYVESGRRFTSKRQIYADALRRLASESKKTGGVRARPPTDKIVAVAGEVFAKLLLAGATGVSANENVGEDAYPYLRSVGPDNGILTFALNSRLFKPTLYVDKHEPVHRVVAEYCAADFLVRRIEDPSNRLSIKRCLAVIAPNGAVRNELRGLLGWMASLGGRSIQKAVLDLDPYAVFANGDPSQLLTSSKQQLLRGLESLAKIDPYFRRMDSWRRFSVAGFFSDDIMDHVRSLLAPAYANSHLRGLLLELLQGTDAAIALRQELRAILHDPHAEMIERQQAHRSLQAMPDDIKAADFDVIVQQASQDSLKIASEMVSKNGVLHLGTARLLRLIEALAQLYPPDGGRERTTGSRYFIRQLVATLELSDVRYLLNEVTTTLACVCGKDKPYRCTCRTGRSKIAGFLLDRYFETMVGPHDPQQIARWTRPLVFRGHASHDTSASVKALSSDNGLRRAIQIAAFDGISTQEHIHHASIQFRMSTGHAGLTMQAEDVWATVDYAFATGNNLLWEYFIARHSPYTERKGVDELRAHMRKQARQSADLLRVWSRIDRSHRQQLHIDFVKFGRSSKSYRRNEEKRKESHFANLNQNRALIESGRHWGWLPMFARNYLHRPDQTEEIVDDPQIVEKALLNCFDFLAPHVPSLEMLSERRGTTIAMVLHAACLATFRQKGSLDGIALNILKAAKTNGVGGAGYQEGEAEKFNSELDRLLFPSDDEAVEFAKIFVERQLTRTDNAETHVYILEQWSAFERIKGATALDWLVRYPDAPSSAREILFGIAALHADRAALNTLIEARCNEPIDPSEEGQKSRKFWLLRHFFFVVPTSDALWPEFSADRKSIFSIENYAGRLSRHDGDGWPQLNAEQIYRVIEAFSHAWPKVHLPDSYGTGDPEDETAYRFWSDLIHQIGRDDPANSICVFDRILSDARFLDFHGEIRSHKAAALRQRALAGFRPPRPAEISKLLDESKIASVEDMRALLTEILEEIQIRLSGAATNPVDVFYSGGERVDENTARNRIVEMIEARLNALHLGIVVEHQMSHATRCDFTASTSIDGSQAVLVTEVKGQWNRELYTAASAQLGDHYTIYPGAADQGVYLVLWFGSSETVAGKTGHSITSAAELRQSIVACMPESLLGRIDVFVLDVSRRKNAARSRNGDEMRRWSRLQAIDDKSPDGVSVDTSIANAIR